MATLPPALFLPRHGPALAKLRQLTYPAVAVTILALACLFFTVHMQHHRADASVLHQRKVEEVI